VNTLTCVTLNALHMCKVFFVTVAFQFVALKTAV